MRCHCDIPIKQLAPRADSLTNFVTLKGRIVKILYYAQSTLKNY